MGSDEETLTELFDRGFQLHGQILENPANLDWRSDKFQQNLRKAVLILEDCTRLVSVLDIFSKNEDISEVQTEFIKYFLLPALLGDLNGKIFDEGTSRSEVIRIQEIYYRDYIQRCNDYGISQVKLKKPSNADEQEENGGDMKQQSASSKMPDLALMNRQREKKLREFKELKEIENRLSELRTAVLSGRADVDQTREFYIKTIKRFVKLCTDELNSFEMEKELLNHQKMIQSGKIQENPDPPKKVRPFKPIIITRDAVQKEVFGLGYKHLPILSIEEFYDQRVRDGWFPDPEKQSKNSLQDRCNDAERAKEAEEEEERIKEKKEEDDDEEELTKKRNWDEWKDDHRRGEGNRHNMG